MNKKTREIIFNKYGGRCAYCGCPLEKGWHVDEIEPVRRYEQYAKDENGERIFDRIKHQYVMVKTCMHPERFHVDNQNPSCPSCNINKHGDSLEDFRKNIAGYLKSLNLRMVQYKMAKKYGLVEETDKPVVFYFEEVECSNRNENRTPIERRLDFLKECHSGNRFPLNASEYNEMVRLERDYGQSEAIAP